MAFTDHSDLYGAVHEEGVNLFVEHLRRQRPSLFHYGSPNVVASPHLWCIPIDAAPGAVPLMTTEAPLPLVGSNGSYALDWCLQLRKAAIDFHPGNHIALPAELGMLQEQEFALHAQVCGGIGCPIDGTLNLPPAPEPDRKGERHQGPPTVIPTRKLGCFCLDLYAKARVVLQKNAAGRFELRGHLLGFEIVDISPNGLEDSLECYIATTLELVVLPRLLVEVPHLAFDLLDLAHITLTPSTTVPFNPSVAKDQIAAFLDVTVTSPSP